MGSYWDTVGFTINLLFDLVGAFLFITLLAIIIKYKNLHRTSCHKLIAIFAICCLGSKVIIVLPYLTRVIPLPDVPLWVCGCTQLVPMGLTSGIPPFTMVIAFDRMTSVFFPIWYLKGRKIGYFLILCIMAALYPVYLGIYIVRNVLDNTFIPTNCTTEQLYGQDLDAGWSASFNLFTIVCYVIMFLRFLCFGRAGRAGAGNLFYKLGISQSIPTRIRLVSVPIRTTPNPPTTVIDSTNASRNIGQTQYLPVSKSRKIFSQYPSEPMTQP